MNTDSCKIRGGTYSGNSNWLVSNVIVLNKKVNNKMIREGNHIMEVELTELHKVNCIHIQFITTLIKNATHRLNPSHLHLLYLHAYYVCQLASVIACLWRCQCTLFQITLLFFYLKCERSFLLRISSKTIVCILKNNNSNVKITI